MGDLDSARIGGAVIRLHWPGQPHHWHVNDGPEFVVVLDGVVDMHFIEDGRERCERLTACDIFYADTGRRHVARPVGEARILVIECDGSV